jgi:membrane associated rhomboid family serine protease
MKETDFKFSTSVLAWPLYFVLSLWGVYVLEIFIPGDFVAYGILPRTITGLKGIFLSPFIHANINHLYNNSIPLFVLIAALRFFYRKESIRVLFLGIVLSGLGTWLIGRDSYHIGASGLVYFLVSFIFFKGIKSKYFRLVALSLTIVVIYGGIIWYAFPGDDPQISWEGHLSGLIAGYLVVFFSKTEKYQKPIKYDWEHPDFDPSQDDFMKHFDENGNFAPIPRDPDPEPEEEDSFFKINYFYKEN